MNEASPKMTDEERDAAEAHADEVLAGLMAGLEEEQELPSEEPGEAAEGGLEEDEAEEPDDEEVAAQAAGDAQEEEPEEDVEEEEPNTDPGYTEDQRYDAAQALRRDGIPAKVIEQMDEAEMVVLGLKVRERQVETDRAFSELGRLRKGLGQNSPEADEGQVAGSGQPQSGAANPVLTGADLTSLARPVAKVLAEMTDDPEQIATVLADFARKAVDSSTSALEAKIQALEGNLGPVLQDTIKARLGADFEGDFDALAPVAAQLGQAGLHGDKTGIDRAVALIRSARLLQTDGKSKPQVKTTSTSRARERGAKPPVAGRKSPTKPMTEEQAHEARIRAILNGETDVEKLRRIG
jgi:hypothetical protein